MKRALIIGLLFVAALAPAATFAQPRPIDQANTVQGGASSAQGGASSVQGQGQTSNQSANPPGTVATLPNPLGEVGDIPTLFYKVIKYVIDISYIVIAVFIIWSGLQFVMARGSSDKLEDAKRTFKYTIIGALIVIGANTLVSIFEGLIKSLGLY